MWLLHTNVLFPSFELLGNRLVGKLGDSHLFVVAVLALLELYVDLGWLPFEYNFFSGKKI